MYLLFAYDTYSADGASKDFVCQYNTFKECLEQIIDVETMKPKSRFTWNEIYDVAKDDWHRFQIVNEVKNGAEYFVEIEYEAPDNEIYIVDSELVKDMME